MPGALSALLLGAVLPFAPCRAQNARTLSLPPAPKGGGWSATDASLLLYGPDGQLVNEIGLAPWEEDLPGGRVRKHQARGGASANGRFAWHWRREETSVPGAKASSVAVFLNYLGTSGQTLWSSDSAQAPKELAPVLQSKDGETALLVEKRGDGWRVAAMTYTGNVLMELRGISRLEKILLAPKGRFALIAWSSLESPLLYSVLDLAKGTRRDSPASELPAGEPLLGDDGALRAGKRSLLAP